MTTASGLDTPAEIQTDLKQNAVGLTGIIMQGVGTIAPAFGIVTGMAFTVSLVGVAAPAAYYLAFILLLSVAVTVSQLAKVFPSAGGWYSWIAQSLHPRAGFIAGWMMLIWMPLSPVLGFAYIGQAVIEPMMKAEYGIDVPWWIVPVVGIAIVALLTYRGISLSTRWLVVFGFLEMGIMVALALTAFARPGDGGVNLDPLNPFKASSVNNLWLAVVFSIFVFSGWENVAPLAEESRNPRRNVPLGLILSVSLVVLFFVVTTWGYIVGLGTNNANSIATMTDNPTFVLAKQLWGGAWWLVLIALINSTLAVAIAMFNGATRTFYAMSRSGVLPAFLSKVDPVRKVPDNALYVELVVCVVVFIVAAIVGGATALFNWGLIITYGLIVCYVLANIGVVRYYWTKARDQFNPVLHLVLPVLSSILAVVVAWYSTVPLPAPPVQYAPLLFVIYALLGLGVLVLLKYRGREDWLRKASLAVAEPDALDPDRDGSPAALR